MNSSRLIRLAHRLLRIAGLEERIQHYVKTQNIPEENLRKLAKADPTNGKYLGWLIKNIVDPDILSGGYWLETVRGVLEFYEKVSKSKTLLEHLALSSDINEMDLDQLYRIWVEHRDEDLKSKAQEGKKAKSTAKLIYSQGPYKVLQIGGEGVNPEEAIKAACAYSKGTAWCTRTAITAQGYLEKGPLFIAFNGNERLFLANYRGSEIKNVSNKDVIFTYETLVLMAESGLLQMWAKFDYPGEDGIFDYLVYRLDAIYPDKNPEFIQYLIDHRMVSPERMARHLELTNQRPPGVEAYIATDPQAAFTYARFVLDARWPEGEPAIRTSKWLWGRYQKYFAEELAHV